MFGIDTRKSPIEDLLQVASSHAQRRVFLGADDVGGSAEARLGAGGELEHSPDLCAKRELVAEERVVTLAGADVRASRA